MAALDGANKRIGIDVGGTNTDAVLMDGDTVLAAVKRPTTKDVASGVIDAVEHLLGKASAGSLGVRSVMIGTTQFINAFVQRKGLARIAAIRVTLPKADAIPPMTAWPEDLITAVDPDIHLVGGGSFYTGVDYAPLDERALAKASEEIRAKGIRAIAITANFSPVRPDLETRAEKIVRSIVPDADITLSHQVGGIGLLDRENAALINASLSRLSREVIASLRQALEHVGLDAPIYISQNDGTLISEDVRAALSHLHVLGWADEQHSRRRLPHGTRGRYRDRRRGHDDRYRRARRRLSARDRDAPLYRRRAHEFSDAGRPLPGARRGHARANVRGASHARTRIGRL